MFHIDQETAKVKITSEWVIVANPDNYPDHKLVILFTMSARIFSELIRSITSRYSAYFTREIGISGLKSIATILGFFGRMKLDMPLYISLGDRM